MAQGGWGMQYSVKINVRSFCYGRELHNNVKHLNVLPIDWEVQSKIEKLIFVRPTLEVHNMKYVT